MKIGIDIDEVLAGLIAGIFEYHNKTRNSNLDSTNPESPFIQHYMNYSPEETADFLAEFYANTTHDDVLPVVGAIEAIKNLKNNELILITIRPEHYRTQTEEWLLHHFSNVFTELHMLGDSLGVGGFKKTKGDLAVELGVQIFIEDSLSNAKNISEKNIPVILLNKPWNQGDLPDNVFRLQTWEMAFEKIKELS